MRAWHVLLFSASLTPSAQSFSWVPYGRGSGACKGPAKSGASEAISLTAGNGIILRPDFAPAGSCMWMTSDAPIDLKVVSRIEVDVRTSGGGDPWFSLWLDPAHYVQPPSNSAEIDLIENLDPSGAQVIRTNFAGCNDGRCSEQSWNVPGNAVNHHITANYNKATSRLEVYHCAYGSATCAPYSNAPFIQLNEFQIGEPVYYVVADIWKTTPGTHFEFSVANLQFLSSPAPGPAPGPGPGPAGCEDGLKHCCRDCSTNRYCPGNKGCYALNQRGCPGGLCPAPPRSHSSLSISASNETILATPSVVV